LSSVSSKIPVTVIGSPDDPYDIVRVVNVGVKIVVATVLGEKPKLVDVVVTVSVMLIVLTGENSSAPKVEVKVVWMV